MIRRILGETIARTGAPFLFAFGGDAARLDGILVDFSKGIGCGLEGVSGEHLETFERAIVWNRRSFFREGYAFALAALAALRGRGNAEAHNRGIEPFRMMHYTGYGFWNGCAETLPLPVLTENAADWTDVEDYPLFYPFYVGGRSFGRLVRAKSVTAELVRSFEKEATPALVQAAWHGAGRALWFRAAGQPEKLVEMLNVYGPAAQPMLIGLGFAMTYTQIATPENALQSLRSMPQPMQHDLHVGGGVALAALIHEMTTEEGRIHSLYGATELGPHLADALEAERITPRNADWYAAFNANMAQRPGRVAHHAAS